MKRTFLYLIFQHSKIVLGEIASLGTLLELGNRTLDILRDLVQRPPGQSITDPSALSGSYTTALGVKEGVIIARRNLEELLLYALTQFAMYLMKPEFEGEQTDMDADDHSMESSRLESTKERRQAPRSTLATRMRRGMTGEMVGDLQALLSKSKPLITASDKVIGKQSIDLTQVLLNFLREHIPS
jgi:nuclear pore complex protein Nup188